MMTNKPDDLAALAQLIRNPRPGEAPLDIKKRIAELVAQSQHSLPGLQRRLTGLLEMTNSTIDELKKSQEQVNDTLDKARQDLSEILNKL